MRTDSVRIADTALAEVRDWLRQNYPGELPPSGPNRYTVSGKAQDAHEGIRPTYVTHTPESLKDYLDKDLLKLYTLIWERCVASQMTPAKTLTQSAEITLGEALFRVAATKVVEKGFYKVAKLLSPKEEVTGTYPPLKEGDVLTVSEFRPDQHFTQGPPRYNDGSFIKLLYEKGIGRPSTTATIIETLTNRRGYVTRSTKQLVPTQLGRIINDLLVKNFPQVLDVGFTAGIEEKLDEIEETNKDWAEMVGEFYGPFQAQVTDAMENLVSLKGSFDEATDQVCEKCGKPLVKKLGRFGYFLACSGFPECRNAKSIPLAKCPKCGGDVIARKTKGRSKEFYGCSNYPQCDFLTHYKPIAAPCPQCGWFLVEKTDKKTGTHKGCINPACDYLHTEEGDNE
jgi:DNA topoisomerase-1